MNTDGQSTCDFPVHYFDGSLIVCFVESFPSSHLKIQRCKHDVSTKLSYIVDNSQKWCNELIQLNMLSKFKDLKQLLNTWYNLSTIALD